MTDLPDVEATVKLVKEILSESLDLVSEKRRFRAFLQDYARRAHTEQGLLLEGKHLKALVSGMGYPRFDEVVSGNKAAAPSVGLRGLGDWLARTEGYDGVLCQWVEAVWSHALGLGGHKVSYGTKGGKPASVVSKAKEAGHRRVEQKKADGAGWAVAAEQGDADKTAPKRAVGAVFRDALRREPAGAVWAGAVVVLLLGLWVWEWLSLVAAAEQGDVDAQFRLGERKMYAEGREVWQDDEEAVKWFRLAAKQENADAQYNLGWMYFKGRGVRQDDEEAVKWYRLAAEQGHASGQFSLGWMYGKGRGVRQDGEEAAKWVRLAAEQGDADAQARWRLRLGSRRQVRLAAEQGDADAQYNLGRMYEQGLWGVRQDDKEAMKWYRQAAAQGEVAAQRALERLRRTR